MPDRPVTPEQTNQRYSLQLGDYQDWYRLRSLLLRVARDGGRFLSAQDQYDAQAYAARLAGEPPGD